MWTSKTVLHIHRFFSNLLSFCIDTVNYSKVFSVKKFQCKRKVDFEETDSRPMIGQQPLMLSSYWMKWFWSLGPDTRCVDFHIISQHKFKRDFFQEFQFATDIFQCPLKVIIQTCWQIDPLPMYFEA